MEFESNTTITNNTTISDSGCSNSCSNSNSQRRHSGSNSSGSSGYCGGAPNPNASDDLHQHPSKRNKDDDHNIKKKLRSKDVSPADKLLECLDASSSVQLNPVLPSPLPEPPILTNVAIIDEPATTSQSVQNFPEKCRTEEETTAPWNEEMKMAGEEYQNLPKEEWISDTGSADEARPEEGFSCVISMQDGLVLYTTSGLTSVLGFPKDTWLGRSFIDFVHPKDRETFSTHVVTGMALPLRDNQAKTQDVKNYLYACLRRYGNPESADASEKSVSYQAFHLTITIKYVEDVPEVKCENNGAMFLVVVAMPVYSSYKVPEESKKSSKFGMRHNSTCSFTHVDPDVVTSFGYLPQDMLGKSIFDFWHPEDMSFLKGVYKSVIKMCQINGSVFRSKPYRFLVQNGCFAMIETEWSSIVNPWSRRLEIVLSLNRVLKGPLNPDVFDVIKEGELKDVSEGVIRESKMLQAEILQMLSEQIVRPADLETSNVLIRCKAVSNVMESLMDEMTNNSLRLGSPKDLDSSISERDFVMLGEISPHHDWESKSSSETPPSYNQLTYNENIKRFFESNPKTTLSDESNGQCGDAKDQRGPQIDQHQDANQKCLSPVAKIVTDTGSGSGKLSSFDSSTANLNATVPSATISSNDSYKPHLTVSVLVKHNEDMAKRMIKQRKVLKSFNKDREHKKVETVPERKRGLKRSGSRSWEGFCDHISKNPARNLPEKVLDKISHVSKKQKREGRHPNICKKEEVPQSRVEDHHNVWPSFSTNNNGAVSIGASNYGNMFPMYYFPALSAGPVANYDNPMVQYLPGMYYNAFQASSPVIYSAMPFFPVPMSASVNDQRHHLNVMKLNTVDNGHEGTADVGVAKFGKPASSYQFQKPASEATSVKAEPGSRMGSTASISLINKVNERKIESPKAGSAYRCKTVDESSSCYSSSFSSFLKTDTGSGSNDDSSIHNSGIKNKQAQSADNKMKLHQGNMEPEWMRSAGKSLDLIYKYQVALKDLNEIIESDRTKLKSMEQPDMVRKQLNQLYVELELQGLSKALNLDKESDSGSSNEESPAKSTKNNRSFNFLTCEEDFIPECEVSNLPNKYH